MNQLSTKELLYLEDAGKILDSIDKTCQHALSEITDSQLKSMISSMNSAHKQWIQRTTGFVTKGTMQ